MKSFINNALRTALSLIAASAILLPNAPAMAQAADPAATSRQDLVALGPIVEQFLTLQSSGSQNRITVELGRLDPRLNLAACVSPEPFLPKGSRPFGRTTVGIRCTAPVPWVVYMQVNIHTFGDYYLTANALAQGQVVGAQDLKIANGDLSMLPAGIVTSPTQAIGRTTSMAMRAGTPLRKDELRSQLVVRQGQTVKVVSNGPGFQITSEATASGNAVDGQMVQARTAAGQTVSGMAKQGGIIEINN
jgi:flagella basal body P-ring formation protein FlgA